MIKKLLKKYVFTTLSLSLVLALMVFAVTRMGLHHPGWMESWYSQGFYPLVITGLSAFSNLFPFSLDDLFYGILLSGGLFITVWVLIRRMAWLQYFKCLVITLALTYSLFNILWGFNYYRNDLTTRLELQTAEANVEELMKVFGWLIEKVNSSYTPIYTIDETEVRDLLASAYREHADFLKIDRISAQGHPKVITLSRLFASATISGYYGPFFGEVHVNRYMLPLELPAVMAHEMAHQLGITSEAEANFYAWYVCTHSADKRLAYSANLYLLRYFAYACYRYEGFRELVKNIRYEVRHDFYKSQFHWMQLMNRRVDMVAEKVNDAYLKSNSVEAGIDDYEGVVKYVMDLKTSE
ncbi:DUF3810 domain-containing protein [Carboxylicivirga sediminis]|uniref:DUF3810 domain-containing protein n=1 Tax=Carboxylicivirga sediminis TaxID=2006564 RepID=A0A941IVU1_9BACT|nr:DUF3810 domain-containing protein [Carboxylicivirga sediminis]MBR8534253.1 DUF3810 domain-containing protein [Carboxylicivirga sediminis]